LIALLKPVEDSTLEPSLRGCIITSIEISGSIEPLPYRLTGQNAEEAQEMDCPICKGLERAFEAGRSEYIEARLSACFRVCTEFAARKNVDMERARYDLEEHLSICVSTVRMLAFLPGWDASTSLKQLAA
jgi:hypothetical protein